LRLIFEDVYAASEGSAILATRAAHRRVGGAPVLVRPPAVPRGSQGTGRVAPAQRPQARGGDVEVRRSPGGGGPPRAHGPAGQGRRPHGAAPLREPPSLPGHTGRGVPGAGITDP